MKLGKQKRRKEAMMDESKTAEKEVEKGKNDEGKQENE